MIKFIKNLFIIMKMIYDEKIQIKNNPTQIILNDCKFK